MPDAGLLGANSEETATHIPTNQSSTESTWRLLLAFGETTHCGRRLRREEVISGRRHFVSVSFLGAICIESRTPSLIIASRSYLCVPLQTCMFLYFLWDSPISAAGDPSLILCPRSVESSFSFGFFCRVLWNWRPEFQSKFQLDGKRYTIAETSSLKDFSLGRGRVPCWRPQK